MEMCLRVDVNKSKREEESLHRLGRRIPQHAPYTKRGGGRKAWLLDVSEMVGQGWHGADDNDQARSPSTTRPHRLSPSALIVVQIENDNV